MARGRFYERFEIPVGASGVATTVHIHHDGDRREFLRRLLERARRRPRWLSRDAEPQIPERLSHAEIRRDARRRVYGSRRDDADVFHYDKRSGWHEGPHARDRLADELRQFRDALRKFYDQGGEDGPVAEFLAWIRSHMDPSDFGKPKSDPNRMNTESVLKYVWPNPKRFAEGFDFKTSGGKSGSERMTAGFGGFRTGDSQPARLQQLNAAHRRHYRGKIL